MTACANTRQMMARVPSSAVAVLKLWVKMLAECPLLTGCSFLAASLSSGAGM